MAFVLPKENVRKGIPEPVSRAVNIREVPARMVAVVAFSGYVNDQQVEQRERQLRSALAQDPEFRVTPGAAPEIAQVRPTGLKHTRKAGGHRVASHVLQTRINVRTGYSKVRLAYFDQL